MKTVVHDLDELPGSHIRHFQSFGRASTADPDKEILTFGPAGI